jgi:hypothetical protein
MDLCNVGVLPQHYNTTRRHNPEDIDFNFHRRENLKSRSKIDCMCIQNAFLRYSVQ